MPIKPTKKEESSIERRSRKMKEIYKDSEIFNKLVMCKNEKGEFYFSLERLTKEELKYVHSRWCNSCC